MNTINSKSLSADVSNKGRSLFVGFFLYGILFPLACFALFALGGA